jgi:hypothetical protein
MNKEQESGAPEERPLDGAPLAIVQVHSPPPYIQVNLGKFIPFSSIKRNTTCSTFPTKRMEEQSPFSAIPMNLLFLQSMHPQQLRQTAATNKPEPTISYNRTTMPVNIKQIADAWAARKSACLVINNTSVTTVSTSK